MTTKSLPWPCDERLAAVHVNERPAWCPRRAWDHPTNFYIGECLALLYIVCLVSLVVNASSGS